MPSSDTLWAGGQAVLSRFSFWALILQHSVSVFNLIQGVTGMDGQPGPKGNVVSLWGPRDPLIVIPRQGAPSQA